MTERTDNYRFYLTSETALGTRLIEEPRDFDREAVTIELQETGRYFKKSTETKVTLLENARSYLLSVIDFYGPDTEVRLIKKVKDDHPLEDGFAEQWKTISNVGVDLYSIELDEEPDNQQISVDLISGGITQLIESRWEDEYDITRLTQSYDDKTDLPFVDVWLEARTLFRRTRWNIDGGQRMLAGDLWPTQAYGVPMVVDQDVKGDSNGGNQTSSLLYVFGTDIPANLFYQIADRPITVTLDFEIEFTGPSIGEFAYDLQLVVFENGTAYDLKDRVTIHRFFGVDQNSPVSFSGQHLIALNEGDSLALTILHTDPVKDELEILFNDSRIFLEYQDNFEGTCTRALKPVDLFTKLCAEIGVEFDRESSPFKEGGKMENYLIAHGTWLRRVPQIVNPRLEDERRVQSVISLKDAFEYFDMIEPLRFEERFTEGRNKFYIGYEKETQRDYISLSLRDTNGNLQEVSEKKRNILTDNYYGLIEIGSDTSGSNYGKVNNIFSTSGKAQWRTPNERSSAKYEKVTSLRTGSEDIELTRQEQWSDNPGVDSEYDNEWFLIDCELGAGTIDCPYSPRKWDYYFDEIPAGVFSPQTNYNWPFRPSNLLFNHSWKIAPAVWYANGTDRAFLSFVSSNCNSSLTTKEPGLNAITEDQNIYYGTTGDERFKRPTVKLIAVDFKTVLTQDVIERLEGEKNGLIEYLFKGERKVGRLIKATAEGTFTLIEAR